MPFVVLKTGVFIDNYSNWRISWELSEKTRENNVDGKKQENLDNLCMEITSNTLQLTVYNSSLNRVLKAALK